MQKENSPGPARTRKIGRRSLLTAAGITAGAAVVGAGSVAFASETWHNPAIGRITSGFRPPSRPYHAGTDVANNQGTALWAARAGTVVGVRTNSYPGDPREGLLPGRTGNAVLIEHSGGYLTYYGHMHTVSVSNGQSVSGGAQLGTMGETGNATGPHVHFELHVSGTPTDPQAFLANQGVTLGTGGSGGGWPAIDEPDSGWRVYVIQHLLTAHGISTLADGDFGPGTTASVKSFQSDNGLVTDGQVGPYTWPQLIIEVKQGSSGSSAKAAQVALNANGADLLVDGDFGSVSDSAARAYQQNNGLHVDGEVGPYTWASLI